MSRERRKNRDNGAVGGQGPMGSEEVSRMKMIVGASKEGEKGRGWVKGSPGVHSGDFCLHPKPTGSYQRGSADCCVLNCYPDQHCQKNMLTVKERVNKRKDRDTN